MLKITFFNVLALHCIAILVFSCAGSSTAYQMDSVEKEKQRGYHANAAKKLIDTNQKNRSANKKAAENDRVKANNDAAEKARIKKRKGANNNATNFSFY